MKQLFSPVDTSPKGLYFFEREKLFLRFDEQETHEVEVENVLVGPLEYFLGAEEVATDYKLFEIFVARIAKLKFVPFKTADRMMRDFRFGFNSNIFLARLLELTNNYYSKTSRKVPKELWQYKLRAEQFARLTNAVLKFGVSNNIPELVELAERKIQTSFYMDGTVLSREVLLKAISTPSKPLSDFVVRYQKNSAICREGNRADSMFVLLKGRVAVSTFGRRAATIEQEGEAFGEAAFFLDGRRTATLIAETDADLYVIPRNELAMFFKTHRDLFRNIASTLAYRIHENIKNARSFQEKLRELKLIYEEGPAGVQLLDEKSRFEVQSFRDELMLLERRSKAIPSFAQFLDLVEVKNRPISR